MSEIVSSEVLTDPQVHRLADLRLGLLRLHKTLLEMERINYEKLIKRLDVAPDEFMMIGNSLKSDVLPVLEMGGHAIHIPFHTTWEHERISHQVVHENFRTCEKITDVLPLLLEN